MHLKRNERAAFGRTQDMETIPEVSHRGQKNRQGKIRTGRIPVSQKARKTEKRGVWEQNISGGLATVVFQKLVIVNRMYLVRVVEFQKVHKLRVGKQVNIDHFPDVRKLIEQGFQQVFFGFKG